MDCKNMPDLVEQMYCSQQILIPPNLPSILKKYAKAAIRTQPRDLLLWSLYYFRAVANGLPPPVKERIEYPPVETESGLTPGFLKVLLKQIGGVSIVHKDTIIDKWEGICLERKYAEILFKVGSFPDQVEWIKFVALAAGTIEKNITGTMSLLCELLTEEPDGGSAMIPIDTFLTLYKYLAALDCGPIEEEKSDTSESSPSEEQIEYSMGTKEGKVETWDNLLRDIGDQKSALTIATDDLREVDSRSGLDVWPDIVPETLQPEKVLSPQLSNEIVTSQTGMPIWDEDNLKETTEKKIEEIIESEEEKKEEGIENEQAETNDNDLTTDEASEKNSNLAAEKAEDSEANEWTTDAETHEPSEEDNEKAVTALDQEMDVVDDKSTDKVTESAEAPQNEPEKSVEDEELPPVVTMLEADSDMGMIPTPAESRESICTEGKSIKSITASEQEPSTGQLLKKTTSLRQVNIRTKKAEEEHCPPDWAPGDKFRIYIPGIGPPVPQEIVEEVEAFLRKCSAKQCGMVMPRNLRHFLCPSLDGLPEEVYEVIPPECMECNQLSAELSCEKLKVKTIEDHIII